ncbi:MAG: glucose 1-dehydrogenase [Cyanobacteria bacterium P01_A01_bin.40]
MSKFDGKVVLITGGGQGIGKATALAFARNGATVVLGNRNKHKGEQVVAEISNFGGQATFQQTDVTKADDLSALTALAMERFGRLDVALNNAGVMHPALPTDKLSDDDFQFVMNVNVRGVWLGMKNQIPAMLASGGGSIVNISSVLGFTAVSNNAAYVASKHAVLGLTKVAALEYGSKGIRVNAVSPAITNTDMAKEGLLKGESETERMQVREAVMAAHPIGRFAEPEDIAAAILWLAGKESSYVLGQSITVDGGYSAQ